MLVPRVLRAGAMAALPVTGATRRPRPLREGGRAVPAEQQRGAPRSPRPPAGQGPSPWLRGAPRFAAALLFGPAERGAAGASLERG